MANIDKIKVGSTTYSILDSATAQIVCDNEESGNTASKTYQKGEFLKINGKLYKTTAIVASGGTLTEGVNITETNVGDELSALTSELADTLKMDGIVENFAMGVAGSWTAVSNQEYDVSAYKWIGAKIHHPDVSVASSPFNFITVDEFKNSSSSRSFFAFVDENALISLNGDSSKAVLVAYSNTTHKISYYRGTSVNANVRLLIVGVK